MHPEEIRRGNLCTNQEKAISNANILTNQLRTIILDSTYGKNLSFWLIENAFENSETSKLILPEKNIAC